MIDQETKAAYRQRGRVRIATFAAALSCSALALITPNPGLTVLTVASLATIVVVLWRPPEPPVLLFVGFMQWAQGAIKVFQADLRGIDMSRAWYGGADVETACALSLIWVPVLAIGMRLALAGVKPSRIATLSSGPPIVFGRLFQLYVVWTLGVMVVERIPVAGLRQVAVALQGLRWAIVFALLVHLVRPGGSRALALTVFVMEFANGWLSFFSSFKGPLFLLGIVLLMGARRVSLRQMAGAVVVAGFTLYVGLLWFAVRGDYRDALNRGTGTQIVSIGRSERVKVLLELVGDVDAEKMDKAVDLMVNRMANVDLFGYTLVYVPAVRPHADGRLWEAAFRHVLMPRLLFPNKPSPEFATRIAERYTGLYLASEKGNTSITLGLPALAYVDFGRDFMFAVALAIGVVFGLMYRYFLRKRAYGLMAQGFAVAMLFGHSNVGVEPAFVLGGQLALFLVALVAWRVLAVTAGSWLWGRSHPAAARQAPAIALTPRVR